MILAPSVIIGAGLVGFDKLDPYYETEKFIPARIVRLVHGVGKTRPRIEVTIKTDDGKEHWFVRSSYFRGKVGDKVKLRINERKYTGLQRYELEI